MTWTTADGVKQQLRRLWERGELLRALAADEPEFPLRLTLKGPTSAELANQFEAVRRWIAGLTAIPHLRIEWREVHHRVMGAQRVPQCLWVDRLDDAFALIGKRADAARFLDVLKLTCAHQPALLRWVQKHPLQALTLAEAWPSLLAVVGWMLDHPRPGVYLRQVDLPGVATKFIEAHRGVLAELFDLVLPPDAIDAGCRGVGQFAARYGFLDKPARLRFRVLDDRMALLHGPSRPDVTLDAASFARLDAPLRRVFITENEANFLAFPPVEDAIVLFGAGYGWESLARAEWLTHCAMHYWGDIDTHGFAILDQLRSRFAHVRSFLMDRATLLAHEPLWGEEPDQASHDLPRLTAEEHALYDDLRGNRLRHHLRLEQERIGFRWIADALARLAGEGSAVESASK